LSDKNLVVVHLLIVILLIGPKRRPSSSYHSSSTHSSLGFVLRVGPSSLGLFQDREILLAQLLRDRSAEDDEDSLSSSKKKRGSIGDFV
jgi:hypothetical protein